MYQSSNIWDMSLVTTLQNADIKRQISNVFIITNIRIRKYSRCSVLVKTALFKSVCLCLYYTA